EAFGVRYQSWGAFQAEHAERLRALGCAENFAALPRTWAFFGNSFVQGPGMLADTARAAVTDRCVFNLGRHEVLLVRLAQIKLLLEQGLKPERIFFVLLPLDIGTIAQQPPD